MQSGNEETKQEIAICILGQDGHGKSTLVAAMYALLLHENKKAEEGYEVTISIGNCREVPDLPLIYETDSRRYSLYDFATHSDVVKNLILNWIPLDAAILVVSAVDGVTEQTRPHVRLARAAGMPIVAVFLNKCDLSDDPELLDLVEDEILEMLGAYGYAANTEIIRGIAGVVLNKQALNDSEHWKGKLRDLIVTIDAFDPARIDINELPFLMQIEEMFEITQRGTVVMGYVETGNCAVNVPVEIVGFGPARSVIATDLESFRPYRNIVAAGNTASLLLRNVKRTEVLHGQVVSTPGTIQAYSRFRAELYLCTGQDGALESHTLKRNSNIFRIRTAEVNGTMSMDTPGKLLNSGDIVEVTVELKAPIALERGVRFSIQDTGRSSAIGIVTEVLA